jgi:hypothetical protein
VDEWKRGLEGLIVPSASRSSHSTSTLNPIDPIKQTNDDIAKTTPNNAEVFAY